MNRVVLSPRAKADLNEIWEYSLIQWGVEQAEKYVRELWSVIEAQASELNQSIDVGNVRPGYRKARSGSHVIFLKVTIEGIDVMRILHRKMDFDRHF